ncbi:MAG: hypothetical protein KJ722_05710, partial [Candidatus Omnitrophica bacterium]|nr:hypothetical protein [Candidatus Omnitrophota bacterium]
TLLYMRLFDIGIPIVTTLIAIFILMTFSLSEKDAYDIRGQIERRREERRKRDELEALKLEEERRKGERRKE